MWRLVLLAALLSGCSCSSFAEVADGGLDVDLEIADASGDGGAPDGPSHDSRPDGRAPDLAPAADGQPDDLPPGDLAPGDLPPVVSCRTLPLPCLNPSPPSVIEVPSEATNTQAFAQAKPGDTIQIKGGTLGYGWKLPALVTLRGCGGATINGDVAFVGSGGTVEGFEVAGQIIANQTGAYTIRANRFVGAGPAYGVSARSADSLVSATVTAVVEGNWFEKRPHGIESYTNYDTLTHAVELTVRNNIFVGVDKPIVISEAGMAGKITATIEHNTLYDFTTGISLSGIDAKTDTRGNLLVKGVNAVKGNSVYEVSHSALWQVGSVGVPPFNGSFTKVDPGLAAPAQGDLRPSPTSKVVDAIPPAASMPAEDYFGCPRPAGGKGDIGAIELQ